MRKSHLLNLQSPNSTNDSSPNASQPASDRVSWLSGNTTFPARASSCFPHCPGQFLSPVFLWCLLFLIQVFCFSKLLISEDGKFAKTSFNRKNNYCLIQLKRYRFSLSVLFVMPGPRSRVLCVLGVSLLTYIPALVILRLSLCSTDCPWSHNLPASAFRGLELLKHSPTSGRDPMF